MFGGQEEEGERMNEWRDGKMVDRAWVCVRIIVIPVWVSATHDR
jgi:hypothetical protein